MILVHSEAVAMWWWVDIRRGGGRGLEVMENVE